MSQITEQFIKQCSLTLSQFDSKSVNTLVILFRRQNACAHLIYLSNNLKEKFENLLTSKRDDDEIYNDTPLTRIELALMIRFKQKYLSDLVADNDNNQSKPNLRISINEELDFAYCFLLAQIDDRLSKDIIDELKFVYNIRQPVTSLLDIHEKLGGNFPKLFSILHDCKYFADRMAIAVEIIHNFQLFIQRYEDFLITFVKYYKPLPDNENNSIQTDCILNPNDTREISSFMNKLREQPKPSIPVLQEQTPKVTVSRPPVQQPVVSSSSSNVPQKALCVIINIMAFNSSQPTQTPNNRAGSDKDVDLIKVVFNKLKFTILECNCNFTKDQIDLALHTINDKNEYGNFDCLVMFIMSHGHLHTFLTADSKEVVIRDIIRRFGDTYSSNIWIGKPRLFFIQACRSPRSPDVEWKNAQGVKPSDLSPRMLVAFSCSPNEASKRSPTTGSNFIQIFCIMVLKYGAYMPLPSILDWTAKFVMKRDEFVAQYKQVPLSIQQPDYIQREFSLNFRFSTQCLYDIYHSWDINKTRVVIPPLRIWGEIYSIIFQTGPTGVISG